MPLAVLALAGCCLSTYLAFYQIGISDAVWDPLFGEASVRVLTSPVSRALPIPDALIGAMAYLIEALLEVTGNSDRWRRTPWAPMLFGALAALMALGGLGLVLLQAFYVRAWCTLCLSSALISWALFWFAIPEVRAALRLVISRYQDGLSTFAALQGET